MIRVIGVAPNVLREQPRASANQGLPTIRERLWRKSYMSPELINNIATLAGVIVTALGAFIFALWVAMGIWTFNDIRSRTRDWLAILLAVLLVMVFPLIGLILYTLIRPKTTLADVYDRALEEEALLRELEETHACPTCGVPVRDNWVFCPNCHAQLQHTCPTCNNMVRNEWAICVYCGTPQRGGIPAPAPRVVSPEIAGMAQPSLAGGATAAVPATSSASNSMRRNNRNPFTQQSALPGGSAASQAPSPAPIPPSATSPATSSTYAPPTYTPSAAPDLDLDIDDSFYRPSRPSEGS